MSEWFSTYQTFTCANSTAEALYYMFDVKFYVLCEICYVLTIKTSERLNIFHTSFYCFYLTLNMYIFAGHSLPYGISDGDL